MTVVTAAQLADMPPDQRTARIAAIHQDFVRALADRRSVRVAPLVLPRVGARRSRPGMPPLSAVIDLGHVADADDTDQEGPTQAQSQPARTGDER